MIREVKSSCNGDKIYKEDFEKTLTITEDFTFKIKQKIKRQIEINETCIVHDMLYNPNHLENIYLYNE